MTKPGEFGDAMHAMNLRWSAAADEAARIAEAWNKPGEPGGAIALFDADKIRAEACGGLADLATGAKFSADTVSRYASITKHVFASMLLAHADKMTVDDALGAHSPFLTGPTRDVSIGRALDMTGGLADLRETLTHLGVEGASVCDGPSLIAFAARNGAVNFPAGTEISYSNTGYRLTEHALRLKGVDFEEHLQTRLNTALGLNFHAPEHWFDPVNKLAPGYWKSGADWRLATSGMQLSASGCLTGSVRDLSLWLQALMTDRGPAKGALATLSALRHLTDGRATDYGLGLARTQLGSRTLFGHGGSHAGYKAYFLIDPESQVGVALASNREDTVSFDGALSVMAALFGETLAKPGSTLNDGLYAAPDAPFWLEIKGTVATFMGAGETLYAGADGESVTRAAHFPMRLKQRGAAIVGEIGHRAHRFEKVVARADDKAVFAAAQGEWRHASERAAFIVEGDQFTMGAGATARTTVLTPLGGDRFIGETPDGPWPKRFLLSFRGDRVDAATNRSRIVSFKRA